MPDLAGHCGDSRSLTDSQPKAQHVCAAPGKRPMTGETSQADSARSILVTRSNSRVVAPGHDKRMLDPDFVLDQDGREKLITRFGAGVQQWCATLPEAVQMYCLRWHLELNRALSGNSFRMFIGRQHGNRGIVLKTDTGPGDSE